MVNLMDVHLPQTMEPEKDLFLCQCRLGDFFFGDLYGKLASQLLQLFHPLFGGFCDNPLLDRVQKVVDRTFCFRVLLVQDRQHCVGALAFKCHISEIFQKFIIKNNLLDLINDDVFNPFFFNRLFVASFVMFDTDTFVIAMHLTRFSGAALADHKALALAAVELGCQQIFILGLMLCRGFFVRCHSFLYPVEKLFGHDGGNAVWNNNITVAVLADVLPVMQHAGNITELPAVVCDLTRDEAAVLLVDSNLHREHILPSEKAFACKLKMEALGRQGKRTDLTSGQVVPKSGENRTGDLIGAPFDESYKTVQRYIRLTHLIPPLLDMMDEGKIAFSVGVELSYLDESLQRSLLSDMEALDCTPSYAQAVRMHKEYNTGLLREDRIGELLSEPKPNQRETLKLPLDALRRFAPRATERQLEEFIFRACEYYQRYLKRQRDLDSR